jgi:hypothetical protein
MICDITRAFKSLLELDDELDELAEESVEAT